MKLTFIVKYRLTISILLVIFFSSCDPRHFSIPTPSMAATIPVGSRVIILDEEPERNDIIIFKTPFDPETYYIFRMVAVAGDSFKIEDSKIFVNGFQVKEQETIQHSYLLETSMSIRERFFEEQGISGYYQTPNGYLVHVTKNMANKLKAVKFIKSVTRMNEKPEKINPRIYPDFHVGNTDYFGPLYIPKKGDRIKGELLKRFAQTIRDCEGINIEPLDEYVFKNSYCFVMGDNRHNSEDSRFIGLIPMQNVMGKGTVWYKPD